MSQRYDLPIPFGWFVVALSNELSVTEVKPLHYFDRDLVLFRTQSGGRFNRTKASSETRR